ncbi:hypothetical protein GCM10009681_32070 [Luedemannella helvata]|uniref:EF-hand domain-containing protein n=1 Tax=Luedemannella helvata TaxID=349315 RepID=A0ABP4WQF7_9ACTN
MGKVGYGEVPVELDCTARQAQRAVEGFLLQARVDDALNTVYFSTHGLQDRQGKLYFAFSDTEKQYLSATAVAAEWVRDRILDSRSKATLVLVDCCFSGGFISGMQARSAGAEVDVDVLVRDVPQGSGVAVLTASGEREVSFEDINSVDVRPSYFTEAVVAGIGTGAADLNHDGRITVDELYEYVYHHVVSGPSPQRPRKLGMGEGSLVIAETAMVSVPAVPTGSPSPRTAAPVLHARGVLGYAAFDGQWIVIGKDGIGSVLKGELRLHVSELAGVAFKPATSWHYGYLQVIPKGTQPLPTRQFGPNAGRPPIEDAASVSFARAANHDMLQIREAIEAAIGGPHGGFRTPPRRRSAWAGLGRALFWMLGVLAVLAEVVVVAVTVTDNWDDHSTGTAVVGNLLSGIAVLLVGRVLYVNHRR